MSINNIVCFKQHCLGLPVLSQMTSPFRSPRAFFSVSDDNASSFRLTSSEISLSQMGNMLEILLSQMTIHIGFSVSYVTLAERAGALGQPREDCTGRYIVV